MKYLRIELFFIFLIDFFFFFFYFFFFIAYIIYNAFLSILLKRVKFVSDAFIKFLL